MIHIKKLSILVLLIATASCTTRNSAKVQSIDTETVKTDVIGKDVQWVDVRTAKEYEAGRIDDAINIDVSDAATFIEKTVYLDKEKPIYLYCRTGGRSKRAAQQLKDLGFRAIFEYSGGYSEWSKQ